MSFFDEETSTRCDLVGERTKVEPRRLAMSMLGVDGSAHGGRHSMVRGHLFMNKVKGIMRSYIGSPVPVVSPNIEWEQVVPDPLCIDSITREIFHAGSPRFSRACTTSPSSTRRTFLSPSLYP